VTASRRRPTPIRRLIVNGDDFGASWAINRGVIQGHEYGILTSASLMVCRQAAAEAAAYARAHPSLAVGIHIDLGEWVYRDKAWEANYERVDLEDASALRKEIARQIGGFRTLVGRDPTHVDSHQHVHNHEPARAIIEEVSEHLGVYLRGQPGITHCGDFYGQDGIGQPMPELVSVAHLVEIIRGLGSGVTELMCHVAAGLVPDSVYSGERSMELAALRDPRVIATLEEERVRLCSFAELDRAGRQRRHEVS
jgi:predicted glycoside hydrolase/deacetylase ChbG (UPF0249 family)